MGAVDSDMLDRGRYERVADLPSHPLRSHTPAKADLFAEAESGRRKGGS